MTLEEIKKIIIGSSRKHLIIGLFILAFGLLIAIGAELGLDRELQGTQVTIAMVIGGIFVATSLILVVKSFRTIGAVKNETHPLIEAIRDKRFDALIWVHGLTFAVEGGITSKKNWNLILHFRDAKRIQIEIKNETVYNQMMAYLSRTFPEAEMGYNDEVKARMKATHGIS